MSCNYKVLARQIVYSVLAEMEYLLEFYKFSDDWEKVIV